MANAGIQYSRAMPADAMSIESNIDTGRLRWGD
jgi:hypothetical protein